MNFLRKTLIGAVFCLFLVQLGGCAMPVSVDNMTTTKITPAVRTSPWFDNLAIGEISGGHKTNHLWQTGVASDRFGDALRKTLAAADMLADPSYAARYHLAANIVDSGTDADIYIDTTITAIMRVRYLLRDASNGEVVFSKIIVSQGSATTGDAVIGTMRQRLALENAARNNILRLVRVLQARDTTGPKLTINN